VMITIDIPEDISIEKINLKKLEENWNAHPAISSTKKIGDTFIDSLENCILKVPSAVVKGDFNYLINPYHNDFKRIKIIELTNFPFDNRMF